jgi:nitroimidazol reductase NimA-like FMN-containing flavoprotein (pyridoxamine 5'-phosphate oxidase superfamily)
MEKTKQEINDEQIMKKILGGAGLCRISMMDGDRPYTLPLTYGYKDKCIYINSAPGGKKIELLSRNPEVQFEIECTEGSLQDKSKAKEPGSCQSLVGHGRVEIISDTPGKKSGMEVIMSQHGASGLDDLNPRDMDYLVILKLNIDSLQRKPSNN